MTGSTKLSPPQVRALEVLREAGVAGIEDGTALVMLGGARKRILEALGRRGLARYFPTPDVWKLTPKGRAELDDRDALSMQADVKARNDAAVEKWQEKAALARAGVACEPEDPPPTLH